MWNRRTFISNTFLPLIRTVLPGSLPKVFAGGSLLLSPFAAYSSVPEKELPTLQLSSAKSGVYDYTFGQVFKRGAVPAGTRLRATTAHSQVDWLQTWSDGSLLQAAVSVQAPLSAVPQGIGFEVDAAPVAAPLTLADLVAASPKAAVALSGKVTAQIRLLDLLERTNDGKRSSPGLVKQRISGPVMSEWKFYSPVPDSHLSVWFSVRLYASGALWVRTTVENGWLKVPSPTSYEYDAVVEIGGDVKWSGPVAHPHHARWSLAYWAGVEPEVVPYHDKAYLRATRLVPNYVGKVSYGASYSDKNPGTGRIGLISLAQSCAPMERANHPNRGMGAGGFGQWIGLLPYWDVAYILEEQGDERAWRGLIANADAANRYSYHYRDENTMLPVRPTQHPYAGIPDALSGGFSGFNNNVKLPTPTGLPAVEYAISHAPAPPYLAALMTGDDHYSEECAFLMCIIFGGSLGNRQAGDLPANPYGRGIQSMIQFVGANRAYSWTMRTFFMAARVAEDRPLRAELIELLSRDFARSIKRSIEGSAYEGKHKNNLGIVFWGGGAGSSNGIALQQVWMLMFGVGAYGLGWDMDLPFSSQQKADFRVVRDFVYKLPIGMLGDLTGFCWRRGNAYASALAENDGQEDPHFAADFAQVWARHYIAYPTLDPLSSCGYGETQLSGGDNKEVAGSSYAGSSGLVALFPAIAYAVDHGAPGSVESYTRLTGSPSFTRPNGGRHYWDTGYSLWSVLPRSVAQASHSRAK